MKVKEQHEIIKQHVEKFGVLPVVTGAGFFDERPYLDRVAQAIADGQPYIEDPVPDDIDI